MKEINFEELNNLSRDSYVLIDIRDEGLTAYGMIKGAISITEEELAEDDCKKLAEIPADKKLVFYCQIGRRSRELDEFKCLEGRDCYSLEDGYIGYVRSQMTKESDIEEKKKKAEAFWSYLTTLDYSI